ncbi:unnamed protein product [Peniophora sp. CBMAI 1063]|nr:unnamed protein product [Peniophora sp. CBMAI 1063]
MSSDGATSHGSTLSSSSTSQTSSGSSSATSAAMSGDSEVPVRHVWQDIKDQLVNMNVALARETAAFAEQRKKVAAHQAVTTDNAHSVEQLGIHLDKIDHTLKAETAALRGAVSECFSQLTITLDRKFDASESRHKRMIAALQQPVVPN